MQRLRAPQWFTHGAVRDRVNRWWPWALGALLAAMYYKSPEPFEEVRTSFLFAFRRRVLRSTEWLEVRDVNPEMMALDLPPDQVFGPLPIEQQIQFALAALRNDNELADGYVTRLVIDLLDLSLDPPAPRLEIFAREGGAELLDFAINDFIHRHHDDRGDDSGSKRQHRFFDADRFLRLVAVCVGERSLANIFTQTYHGIPLLFEALAESTNEYARVLVARTVTLCAMQQEVDGEVERELVDRNLLPPLLEMYRQNTGDPTDTRFITLPLSSVIRLYPQVVNSIISNTTAKKVESDETDPKAPMDGLIPTIVTNLDIARYKGIPQHLRLLNDLQAAATNKPENISKQLAEAQFLPVALGILDVFPEYLEAADGLLHWVERIRSHLTPFDFLEYRFLTVMAKLAARNEKEDEWKERQMDKRTAHLIQWVLKDPEVSAVLRETVPKSELGIALRDCQAMVSEFA